ncbi:hypothetical protein D9613_009031 [Agrocybe pediades]|uniref:Uncharacterized protein n=1 Tax=Agrocybe pediades TaxID=84607 RepID=A0A8H4R4Y1_9AGAR|nr:hypothetical protein D9613_009031 [Agrocybe pediades]
MSVNHFGTYILTRTLLPLMAQTSKLSGADVRIVTLSSVAHAMGRAEDKTLTFKGLDDFKREYADDTCPGWSRYTVSKLANLLFARQLQRYIDKAGLDILSTYINPGEVNTFADRMPFPKISKVFMGIFFAKPEQGAYTSCFAAASPLVRIHAGKYRDKYLVPVGKIGKLGKNAKREDLAVNLWTSTEKILEGMGIYMPEL